MIDLLVSKRGDVVRYSAQNEQNMLDRGLTPYRIMVQSSDDIDTLQEIIDVNRDDEREDCISGC